MLTTDTNGSGDSFYLSYLTAKSDVDYYKFPVPAAGSRVTFHLSHLPADYDLVVYGPAGSGTPRPPQSTTPPIDGQPLADTGFATTHATDPLAPQTLNDVALAQGLPVDGVSTLRGTQDDAVSVISNGEGGNYTVQVSGFNGATSNDPYMLRVATTPPPAPPACTPRTLGTAAAATTLVTTATGQVARDVNTLFVVDDQQLSRIYSTGTVTGANVVTKLNSQATLSGFANAGFPAAVVHVDANPRRNDGLRGLERLSGRPRHRQPGHQVDRRRARHRAHDVPERRVRRARRRRRRPAVLAARRPDDPLHRERLCRDLPVDERARRVAGGGEDALRRSVRHHGAGALLQPAARRARSRHGQARRDPDQHQRATRRLHRRHDAGPSAPGDCADDRLRLPVGRRHRGQPGTRRCGHGHRQQDGDQRHLDEEHADRAWRAALPVERRAAHRTSSR